MFAGREEVRCPVHTNADMIFAGSEGIFCGFKNAQLLPRCISAASPQHKPDTLKATMSDLSCAGASNYYLEGHTPSRQFVLPGVRLFMAFKSAYPHFWQKAYPIAWGGLHP